MKTIMVTPGSRHTLEQTKDTTHSRVRNNLPYTEMEIAIAALSAQGKTPMEIAEHLLISIPMVDDLLNSVVGKARSTMIGC